MAGTTKIGACDWALPGNRVFAPRIAHEYGLEALSLFIGDFTHHYPLAEPVMQRFYLEEQQRYGIEYCAIALNDFDNFPIHAKKGTKGFDIAKLIMDRGLQAAAGLKATMIQVPNFAASQIKSEEDMHVTAQAFQYLCDRAGEHGIQVACENCLHPTELKVLIDLVDRPNFGLYYDSQNYYLMHKYDQVEMLEKLFGHMVPQLHVKDGNGALSGALLGTGDTNFFGIMDFLKQHHYQGYYLLENYYDQLPLRTSSDLLSPYDLLQEDIRILKAALA